MYYSFMEKHIKFASSVAYMLDSQFGVGKIRFGYGSLINLVPGIGDFIDAIVSFYIIWIAVQVGVPTLVLFQMFGNIIVSFLIGLIPLAGDAYYFIRKVNMKNVALLKKYAPSNGVETGKIIS